jgi:hypothetical protein
MPLSDVTNVMSSEFCTAGIAVDLAAKHHRPMLYLNSSRIRKEDEARKIQQRDKIELGLIAVFSCVEPCRT